MLRLYYFFLGSRTATRLFYFTPVPHFSIKIGYFLTIFSFCSGLKKSLGNLLLVPAVDILLLILLVPQKGLPAFWYECLGSGPKLD